MVDPFDQLFARYDTGQIGRRELLGALAALLVASPVSWAAEPAVGEVKQLNHVTVFVPDVKKSVEFYQRLFGMPVLTNQAPGVNLTAGGGFLGLYPAQAAQGRIDHVCLGLEKFDADAVVKKLADAGVKGSIRYSGAVAGCSLQGRCWAARRAIRNNGGGKSTRCKELAETTPDTPGVKKCDNMKVSSPYTSIN